MSFKKLKSAIKTDIVNREINLIIFISVKTDFKYEIVLNCIIKNCDQSLKKKKQNPSTKSQLVV